MQRILFHRLGMQALKGAEPDVQSHRSEAGARRLAGRQYLRRKVQSRRGRGHRAAFPCKKRLVAVTVIRPVRPMDIRRQRRVPDALQNLVQVALRDEFHRAVAMQPMFPDGRPEVCGEVDHRAGQQLAPGPHQRVPKTSIVR